LCGGFYTWRHTEQSRNFTGCYSKIDISTPRIIRREQSPLFFPLTESIEVGRSIFFSLDTHDPFFGHALIIRHHAFRIQHEPFQ